VLLKLEQALKAAGLSVKRGRGEGVGREKGRGGGMQFSRR
jgi:hypothetical protein